MTVCAILKVSNVKNCSDPGDFEHKANFVAQSERPCVTSCLLTTAMICQGATVVKLQPLTNPATIV